MKTRQIPKPRFVDMRKIAVFCNNFNSIGYGTAELTETSDRFILVLYNAGYSENEQMEDDFKKYMRRFMILDRHPISIFELPKMSSLIRTKNDKNMKNLLLDGTYFLKKKFTYKLELGWEK